VPHNWVAHLTGDDEVPSNASKGQGQVKFQLSADGTVLSWRLIASNIENPFMAHIHLGAPGVNGGIVLWLHGTPPANSNPQGTGRQNGVLASGSSTAAGLVGALAGQPMSALIAALDSGNTYVNVHTSDGVSPTNTGVGDLFNGEIRGQIRTAGHGN
jgi:hypothetical protein